MKRAWWQRKIWLCSLCLISLVGLAPSVPLAYSQSDSIAESANIRNLDSVLDEGRHFEQNQQWSEALLLYDRAVREFPDVSELSQRRTLAHIHCDLDRRFHDPSYARLITTIAEPQALNLYQELVLKIRAHYYEVPDWQRLTWRGTANLDIAVTHDAMRQRHIPQASDEQVAAFRQFLRQDVNQRPVRTQQEAIQLVAYAAQQAHQQLQLPTTVSIGEYCCGAISALDQYSSYLTAGELDEVYSQIEGNFVGLGIELKGDQRGLLITRVIPQGPAAIAGLADGDRILSVNGADTTKLPPEEAADLLKGEEHTTVQLLLEDDHGIRREVQVERRRVDVPSVEDVRMLDPTQGMGYFRLTSFQKTTSRDVDAALWQLHRQGMNALIIDLRGNPGGLLTAAVEVADKFLPQGVIVSTRGRSPREDYDYHAHQAGTWRVPLIVMIDHDTASASEILAGAIRDHRRGTIVGERSYGKGSVQGIFPLSAAQAGVRLTTARFFSPNGQAISDHGVAPDRAVRIAAHSGNAFRKHSVPDPDSDPMLLAAKEAAREIILEARARP